MSTKVTGPYMVYDNRTLLGKIDLGEWALFRHEHMGDMGLDDWKRTMLALADAIGIDLHLFDIPHKDMTLMISGERASSITMEEIDESVQALVFHRVMEREVGSEYLVRTGREDPYGKYRRALAMKSSNR